MGYFGELMMAIAISGAICYSLASICGYVVGEVKDSIRTIIREEINRG